MGSLVSVPKISTTPQPRQTVRYVQTVSSPPVSSPAATTAQSSNGSSASASSTNDAAAPSATVAAEREDNLLRRGRGRLGTIRTSFRGFLGPSNEPQRKTLLGE